eukprot:1391286-Rhodomonas_salina.1
MSGTDIAVPLLSTLQLSSALSMRCPIRYAMSGSDIAVLPSTLRSYPSQLRYDSPLSCYASPRRCPVLTYGMALPTAQRCQGQRREGSVAEGTGSYAPPTPCPVPTRRMLLPSRY